MTTFVVAYKNQHTTEIAEKQGDAKGGWQRMSAFMPNFREALDLYRLRAAGMPNSAVALFSESDDHMTPWFTKNPMYLSNRHILFSENNVRSAFGGLINSLDASWF